MPNPEIDYIIRLPEARRMLGNLSPSQFDCLVRRGKLPRPMKIVEGGRAAGYPLSELKAFIEKRKADRR